MKDKTKRADGGNKRESEGSEREGSVLIFLATLIAVLVLGSTPDFEGLFSWLRAWRPL